jgi:hypothetical protein
MMWFKALDWPWTKTHIPVRKLMRSTASSFKWEYPLLSPRSSSNFLRLLPRLLVTSVRLFVFSSITSFRRQFLHKIWPMQLAFRFLISCRTFRARFTVQNSCLLVASQLVVFGALAPGYCPVLAVGGCPAICWSRRLLPHRLLLSAAGCCPTDYCSRRLAAAPHIPASASRYSACRLQTHTIQHAQPSTGQC